MVCYGYPWGFLCPQQEGGIWLTGVGVCVRPGTHSPSIPRDRGPTAWSPTLYSHGTQHIHIPEYYTGRASEQL
jgi:hypothetical protein